MDPLSLGCASQIFKRELQSPDEPWAGSGAHVNIHSDPIWRAALCLLFLWFYLHFSDTPMHTLVHCA